MLPLRRRILIATCLVSLGLPVAARADEQLQYNRDIRPILNNTCFTCHGPAARKGGLRLDGREEAVKPAKSGERPIVAGKPDESELVRRIFSTAKGEQMPPPTAHKKFS